MRRRGRSAAAGLTVEELRAQARRHRLRAEEYRAVHDQVETPAARATYQHLAETYEAMARRLEEDAAKTDQADKEAG